MICTKTHLDSITHEQSIIYRQLFPGHELGSRPMKMKNNVSNDNNPLCSSWNIFLKLFLHYTTYVCHNVYLFPSCSHIRKQVSFCCKLDDEEIWCGLGTTANENHDILV